MRRPFIAIPLLVLLGAAGCRTHERNQAKPDPVSASQPISPGNAEWGTIGFSRLLHPLRAKTIGDGGYRIYIIGGIHGNEPEGLASAARIAELPPSDIGAVMLRILEDANPDGTRAGTRGNARHFDLNRNWPATNFARSASRGPGPLSEPETLALHRDIEEFKPHLIIAFHSIASGPFVNFDGPAAEVASVFAEAARGMDSRWHVVPHMGYRTPGSLGSYFGIDRGVPILTIEFKRGQDSESAAAAAIAGVRAICRSARGRDVLPGWKSSTGSGQPAHGPPAGVPDWGPIPALRPRIIRTS